MDLLIAWLLGTAVVPTGSLIFATGGPATAIVLAALLLAALAALVSQLDRNERIGRAVEPPVTHGEDSRLPSAA